MGDMLVRWESIGDEPREIPGGQPRSTRGAGIYKLSQGSVDQQLEETRIKTDVSLD